jgi:hypothetical protein
VKTGEITADLNTRFALRCGKLAYLAAFIDIAENIDE